MVSKYFSAKRMGEDKSAWRQALPTWGSVHLQKLLRQIHEGSRDNQLIGSHEMDAPFLISEFSVCFR